MQAKLQHETSEAELLERAQASTPTILWYTSPKRCPACRPWWTTTAIVGSFSVNPERPNEVAVCVIDNLQSAAGQALQNLNLALGCDEPGP